MTTVELQGQLRSPTDVLSNGDSSPISPTVAARSNPLSARIANVLSTSYADLDIRDSLSILGSRHFENTPESRRQLRIEVQKEVIQSNAAIVTDFGAVADQLKRIGAAIASLNESCSAMRAQVDSVNKETGPALEEANSLMQQKKDFERKQRILDAFRANYFVSEAELTNLTSAAAPVDDDFFRVLQRVKTIHKDCQVLLGSENQTLGLEILEQSSRHLNAGYQKLFRWVQREFKTLDLENPQLGARVRRSLRVLAERPTLFQSCLDFFAEAREHTLSESFHVALTGFSNEGEEAADATTKPIEMHAHDPLRYVGDMLAWVHSSTVSEREALEVLFVAEGDDIAANLRAGIEYEPWNSPSKDDPDAATAEDFDPRKALNNLVGRDIAGVARVLRQRIEQVLQSHEDATLAYRIANLASFYQATFLRLLDEVSPILDTLKNIEDFAIREFRVNMRDKVAALQSEVMATPSKDDLAPPDFFEESLQTLRQLMKSYDSSLASASAADSDREPAFAPVLDEAYEPFLALCVDMSKRVEQPGNDILLLNCLVTARAIMVPFSFTASRVRMLDGALDEHAGMLVDYQYRFLLHTSGVAPLLSAIQSLYDEDDDDKTDVLAKDPTALLRLPQFAMDPLTRCSQDLDDFLPTALMDAKENLKQLRNASLIDTVTEDAAARFCGDFEVVEARIIACDDAVREKDDQINGGEAEDGEDPRTLLKDVFPRTAGEIRVLLS